MASSLWEVRLDWGRWGRGGGSWRDWGWRRCGEHVAWALWKHKFKSLGTYSLKFISFCVLFSFLL